jgi:glycosyltransferase involved in cell wall biosynthesis
MLVNYLLARLKIFGRKIMPELKILWINNKADFTGGCESYIFHTVGFLKEKGYKNFLLYEVEGWAEPKFLQVFDGAFPRVILSTQIAEIKPDLIFAHRVSGKKSMKELINCGVPVIRFFHDHKLFCLREHKYKTISLNTCTKPTGLRCYPCLGFINRSRGFIKIRLASLAKLRAEQNLNKKLKGFVVASEYMKKHLIAHGFATEKIKVIPLYADEQHKPEKICDGKYLLFAGQILKGKGLDILIRAWKLLATDYTLIIAGEGRQRQKYEKLAIKLGLEQSIKFVGFIKQDKLADLYRNTTCLVMPSRVPETFGLSGLEAMSWSKPVVASDVGGISEWLNDGINGLLVPPNNPPALAAAIGEIINDPERAAEKGRAGFELYKNKFNAEEHISVLTAYFQEITRKANNGKQ